MGISQPRGLLIQENRLPTAFQTLNWIQAPEVIASSGKYSQRCSPAGGQAEQGPVGRVSSPLNTAQTSEKEPQPTCGQEDSSPIEAVCSVPTETGNVKH